MRHDHAVIKHVGKLFSLETATAFQEMPFFYISPEIEDQFTDGQRRNTEGFRRQYPEFVVGLDDDETIGEILPFDEFVVMDHGIGWHVIRYAGPRLWSFHICIDNQLQNEFGIDLPPGSLVHVAVELGGYKIGTTLLEEDRQLEIKQADVNLLCRDGEHSPPGVPNKMLATLAALFADEKLKESMVTQMLTNLGYILSFFRWAESMHMVEAVTAEPKTGAGTKTAVKKPWLRDDMPHYIYLDSPKHTRVRDKDRQEGDPTYIMRGHPRRKHRRKLTNERFKNHPKYGKTIPVKASWVGSRTWTVGGTIYTVKGDIDGKST